MANYLASRGCCLVAQENTQGALDAALADANVVGAEISVLTTNAGDCVLCHDQDLFELIGQHIDIRTLNHQQIEALNIQKQVKGHTYATTAKFMFLDQAFRRYITPKSVVSSPPIDGGDSKGGAASASALTAPMQTVRQSMKLWLSVKNPQYGPWNVCCDHTPRILIDELYRLSQYYNMSDVMVTSTNPFLVEAMRYQAHDPHAANPIAIGYDLSNWGCANCFEYIWVDKILRAPNGTYPYIALDACFASAMAVDKYHQRDIKCILYNVGRERMGTNDFTLIDC